MRNITKRPLIRIVLRGINVGSGMLIRPQRGVANTRRNQRTARASSPALKPCPRGAIPSQSLLVLVVKIFGELLAFVDRACAGVENGARRDERNEVVSATAISSRFIVAPASVIYLHPKLSRRTGLRRGPIRRADRVPVEELATRPDVHELPRRRQIPCPITDPAHSPSGKGGDKPLIGARK